MVDHERGIRRQFNSDQVRVQLETLGSLCLKSGWANCELALKVADSNVKAREAAVRNGEPLLFPQEATFWSLRKK